MGALDLEGRLVWTNPAWEHVLGRPSSELNGTSYLELLHPDDRERALAVQAELAAGQTERPELEVRLRTGSGQDIWVLFNAVYSGEERLLYISGKDVSERAEQSVLDTRYRALVANLPDTVVTLFDTELRIIVAEGAQLARRGLDPDAYAGLRSPRRCPPSSTPRSRRTTSRRSRASRRPSMSTRPTGR